MQNIQKAAPVRPPVDETRVLFAVTHAVGAVEARGSAKVTGFVQRERDVVAGFEPRGFARPKVG